MKKILIIPLIISFISSEAIANSCNAILKHGIRNIQISKGTESSVATKFFNHCHKDFNELDDRMMGNLEVEVFGYGGGGGNLSRDKRNKRIIDWCKANKEISVSNSTSYQESQIIYADALSAWSNCNQLSADKVKITPYISPDARDVDISLKYTGSSTSGVKFYGVKQKGFTCKILLPNGVELKPDKSISPEITNEAISITCTRDQETTETIDGQTYFVLGRGVITIQTASHPLQLFFPKEYSPSLPQQRASKLELEVNNLKKQVESLNNGLSSGVLAFSSEKCPEGWSEYALAQGRFIRGIDRSGENRDPEGERKIGMLQSDQFKRHSHKYHVFAFGHRYNDQGAPQKSEDNDGNEFDWDSGTAGGDETRPKNVALLYCIKV
ncbi:hypothetical protein [uncultured Psychromonas sp.]|uniref:hypothetical protein n=1 Tax=uncultured Psychromonas sp. TaxID=173974 RepID=UPI002603BC19|nr:hypothetical protein [uncultured Psychromonas sp.]